MDAKQVVFDAAKKVLGGNVHFTSVDVANKIKKDGTWLSNSAVAALLHDIVDEGTDNEFGDVYTEKVDFANFTATVYYMVGEDPHEYVPGDPAMTPDEFKALHGEDPFDTKDTDGVDAGDVDDVDDAAVAAPPAQSPNAGKKGYGNDGMKFCFPYDK